MCVRVCGGVGVGGLEKRWEAGRDNKILRLYLFVSLQLLHEGPLVEEAVQALLRVVVA